MKKKLAILGASYLQLPLVKAAKSMDLELHCFAWPQNAVCKKYVDFFYPISVIEKEKILQKCREVGIHGITTIATDLPMPTIAYVAENLNLIGNTYKSSLLSTNKRLMRNAFIEQDCKTPYVYDNLDEVEFPCIVKPVDRSGSRGINIVRSQQFLNPAIDEAIENSIIKEYLIEQYIEGREISIETLSWNGKHKVISITQKMTTGEPRFIELGHYQPANLNDDLIRSLEHECLKCLDALGIQFGASHSEFKITEKNEIRVIEVGARMGGDFIGSHLTRYSTGIDYVKAVIDIAVNQFSWSHIRPYNSLKQSGVIYLTKENKAIFDYIFENYKEFITESEIFNDSLKDIKNSNDRSGYLIYQTENLNLYEHASVHCHNAI